MSNFIKDRLKDRSLFLIGMMGSGKSTVGRLLAEQLGYRFCDTDSVIEQCAQKPIREIFAASGEGAFRDLESTVLAEVSAYLRTVVATGGGIVLQRKNWSYLRHGIVVWLDVPIEYLQARLLSDTTRPLLQESDPAVKLKTLLEQRQALYAQADVRVEYQSGETPEQVAERTIALIQQVIKPDTPEL